MRKYWGFGGAGMGIAWEQREHVEFVNFAENKYLRKEKLDRFLGKARHTTDWCWNWCWICINPNDFNITTSCNNCDLFPLPACDSPASLHVISAMQAVSLWLSTSHIPSEHIPLFLQRGSVWSKRLSVSVCPGIWPWPCLAVDLLFLSIHRALFLGAKEVGLFGWKHLSTVFCFLSAAAED